MPRTPRAWTPELRTAWRQLQWIHENALFLVDYWYFGDPPRIVDSPVAIGHTDHSHDIPAPTPGCIGCLTELHDRYRIDTTELDPVTLPIHIADVILVERDVVKFGDFQDDAYLKVLKSQLICPDPWGHSPAPRRIRVSDWFRDKARDNEQRKASDFKDEVKKSTFALKELISQGRLNGDRLINTGGCLVHEPGLPLPWVTYPPPLHGAFPAFSLTADGPWHLCTCQRHGLEITVSRGGRLDRLVAPCFLNEVLPTTTHHLSWKESICHRCTRQLPHLGTYLQPLLSIPNETPPRWGMYVQMAFYALGIQPQRRYVFIEPSPRNFEVNHGWDFTLDDVDPSVRELVDAIIEADRVFAGFFDEHHQLVDPVENPTARKFAADSKYGSHRDLWKFVENAVRADFGIKPIGSTGQSETVLFNIVKELFAEQTVLRNVRPPWLDGLELDIWIPSLSLAMEYQGKQHFQSVEFWGGQEKLAAQQERDARKRSLCSQLGIELIEFNYDEKLTFGLVRDRLSRFLSTDTSKLI